MDWRSRVTTDPAICHGQVCIKGTRIPVSVVLDNLAAGMTPGETIESYPSLTLEDVSAAVAYAAELARERVIDIRAADGCPVVDPKGTEFAAPVLHGKRSMT